MMDPPFRFHDVSKRIDYALVEEVCRRLRADPSLVEEGRRDFERGLARDAWRVEEREAWRALLDEPVDTICEALLARTWHGQMLRESRPLFCVLPASVRADIVAASRHADP